MIGRIVAHVHVQREILSSFSPRVQFLTSNWLENTMPLQFNHSSTATQLCSTSSRVVYSVHQLSSRLCYVARYVSEPPLATFNMPKSCHLWQFMESSDFHNWASSSQNWYQPLEVTPIWQLEDSHWLLQLLLSLTTLTSGILQTLPVLGILSAHLYSVPQNFHYGFKFPMNFQLWV